MSTVEEAGNVEVKKSYAEQFMELLANEDDDIRKHQESAAAVTAATTTTTTGTTTSNHMKYEHPLVERYATKEMSYIWSPYKKFTTWRKLWTVLAIVEQEILGKDTIQDEQIDEMIQNIYNIDFAIATQKENEFRHDVMGHIHTYGLVAPKAMPIIHLGATSCYVGDNTDIIQIKCSLQLIQRKLIQVVASLKEFAIKTYNIPTLGYTHYQPAQLTTVGKRTTLWIQDMIYDIQHLVYELDTIPLRGVKGTTGTQASFLELFNGNHEHVKLLNERICTIMGFPNQFVSVSGQTYTRKIEYYILNVLGGIAQTAYKMCCDIRLLANLKEMEEPFSSKQIGSSAMAYKRNPMRCERVCSIARYIMNLPTTLGQTHATQWFERTLDDSAIRRMVLPEAFLGCDVILTLLYDITNGLHIWPNVIHAHVMAELPFMATENILMECVKAGGDRQELHELIRVHSIQAGIVVKEEGKPNDLLQRIANDPAFAVIHDKLDSMMDPIQFVGRAPEQVHEFIQNDVNPLLEQYQHLLTIKNVDNIDV